jgi:hypothetical protein
VNGGRPEQLRGLGAELEPQRAEHLDDGVEVGTSVARERLYRLSRDMQASRATYDMPLARAMSPMALASCSPTAGTTTASSPTMPLVLSESAEST